MHLKFVLTHIKKIKIKIFPGSTQNVPRGDLTTLSAKSMTPGVNICSFFYNAIHLVIIR